MGKNNSVKKIDEEQILKRFEYTVQEYIRFYDFYKNQEVSEENTEAFYVMLQTKLMILRKYDYNREDVYLSNVFDAIDKMYPEVGENINILREKFEKLNNYYMEVILSDGTSLNLYKAIEDVMYGLYLHADPDKIERLLKTSDESKIEQWIDKKIKSTSVTILILSKGMTKSIWVGREIQKSIEENNKFVLIDISSGQYDKDFLSQYKIGSKSLDEIYPIHSVENCNEKEGFADVGKWVRDAVADI